jgi:hypothetical protein
MVTRAVHRGGRMPRSRLVALILACGCITSCGADSDAPRAERFRSSVYGFSIELPDGWSAIPAGRRLDDGEQPRTGGGGTDILGEGASPRVSEMDLPAVVIGAQRAPAGLTLEDWSDRVTEIVDAQKGCPAPATIERVHVGSETAVLLSYPDCPAGSGLYHWWTAVLHDDLAFQIVWFDETGNGAADREGLDRLFTGFEFDA